MIRSFFLVSTVTALTGFFPGVSNAIETRKFLNTEYRIVALDLNKTDLSLSWKDETGTAYGTLAARRKGFTTKKPILLANSGIYDRSFRPLGLHVENGHELRGLNRTHGSGGNFGLRPNGVFLVEVAPAKQNRARIVETDEYAKAPPRNVLNATQSGPLLVINGKIHPSFKQGSENRKIRNGVGVDTNGRVFFAISVQPVSFWDFASFFRDGLDCPNALYLDGSISMMADDSTSPADLENQIVPFVGIWTATRK